MIIKIWISRRFFKILLPPVTKSRKIMPKFKKFHSNISLYRYRTQELRQAVANVLVGKPPTTEQSGRKSTHRLSLTGRRSLGSSGQIDPVTQSVEEKISQENYRRFRETNFMKNHRYRPYKNRNSEPKLGENTEIDLVWNFLPKTVNSMLKTINLAFVLGFKIGFWNFDLIHYCAGKLICPGPTHVTWSKFWIWVS